MKKLILLTIMTLLISAIPLYADGSKSETHEMIMVVKPEKRFSNKWCFVIDASSSIWYKPGRGTIARLRQAFKNATMYSSDELYFCVYKFSDLNSEEYMGWTKGTPDDLKKAEKWINKNKGTYSHGKRAIEMALRRKVKDLTIIIITDGGFTSACNNGRRGNFSKVEKAIAVGQKWRVSKGYGTAMICTIGIENKDYWAGGKPDDEYCQDFLKKIGTQYKGGYFLARKKQ